ncbi:MAG: FHA domain-containing protein [Acidimicrobiales bacterium]
MGKPAEVTCPSCSHRNSLGSNFCSSCGVRLGQQRDDRTDAIALDDIVDADQSSEAAEADDGFDRSDFAPDMGVLFVSRGSKAGSRYALDEAIVTAGRHPDSGIFLDDVTVSRRHAELVAEAGIYSVRDVGSLNGTYVNRERIDEAVLNDGDEVQVGKFKLFFFHGTGGR